MTNDEKSDSPLRMHCKIFCKHCNDTNCQKTPDNMINCMKMRLMIDEYFEDSDKELQTNLDEGLYQ